MDINNKCYKLLAIDMDGTLLMPDKTLHPDTVSDLQAACDAGLGIVYCTGRSIPEMRPYVSMLPMIRYGICESGALVYDFEKDVPIACDLIRQQYVLEIIKVSDRFDGMLHFLSDTDTFVRKDQVLHMADYHMGEYQETYLKVASLSPDMEKTARLYAGMEKVNIYFRSRQDRDQGYDLLKHLPLTFTYNEDTALEMTPEGVDKGTGLGRLSVHLGMTPDQIIGIGDGGNDIAMLKAAGLAVAMENADDSVKSVCDIITAGNSENGVGVFIRKYLSNIGDTFNSHNSSAF